MSNNFYLFATDSNSKYLYDVNTNSVHPVPDSVDEPFMEKIYAAETDNILYGLMQNNAELEVFIRYIIIWRDKTDAFKNMPKQDKVFLSDYLVSQNISFINGFPLDLILVVTENCNMRCAYCVYDESVYSSRRTHQHTYMDWEMTQKAIDFYLDLNKNLRMKPFEKRALNIVFYGGEALLNWPIVKKGIQYARQTYAGDIELHIGISTNLTLFDIEWLPFLRENEVFLNVSLDGPQEEHDRFRHLANGQPTFDIIYKKLKEIHDLDSYYFNKYIKALITYTWHTDLIKVADFYENSKYAPLIQMVSPLKDIDSTEFNELYPTDKKTHMNSLINLRKNFEKMYSDGKSFNKGEAYYSLVYDYLSTFFNEQNCLKYEKEWYTGACAPGRKLAVSPNGDINICERVCAQRPVGHVDFGIDESKVLNYFNDFFKASEDCPSCWARNRCRICPAEVDVKQGFDFNNKCSKTKQNLATSFVTLYSLLEKYPCFFKNEFEFF